MRNDVFTVAYSQGYDPEVISSLSFDRDNFLISYNVESGLDVEVNQLYIPKRSGTFSQEIIETFKALNTFEGFRILYAPIKYEGEITV